MVVEPEQLDPEDSDTPESEKEEESEESKKEEDEETEEKEEETPACSTRVWRPKRKVVWVRKKVRRTVRVRRDPYGGKSYYNK